MLRYSYNNIIIVINIVILEFLSAPFVHLTILIFLTQVRRYKLINFWISLSKWKYSQIILLLNNKHKVILYFFFTKMTSELSKYLNEQLGAFSNAKQRKRC